MRDREYQARYDIIEGYKMMNCVYVRTGKIESYVSDDLRENLFIC